MKSILPFIAAGLTALSISCSPATGTGAAGVDDAIAQAQEALDDDRATEAVDICDRLTASADTQAMDAVQYCRVALVYAAAADLQSADNGDIIPHALNALSKAYAIDSTAVNTYIARLPAEQTPSMDMLRRLLDARNTDPADYLRVVDADTTATDPADSIGAMH